MNLKGLINKIKYIAKETPGQVRVPLLFNSRRYKLFFNTSYFLFKKVVP